MIEHLRGREKALESLGWTGREAEWLALVCLHSGVFIRSQFCHYFEARRNAAHRIVRTLIERREAVEGEWPLVNGGGKTCRISSKGIYRALGVENIRHRRKAGAPVVMRRLMSLDFVLEHPGMNWLPTEGEKVEFIEGLGVHSNLIPGGFTTARFALRDAILRSSCPLPVALELSPSPMSIRDGPPPENSTHGERRMDRFGMRSAPRGGGWRLSSSVRNWMRFCGRIECYSFGRRRSRESGRGDDGEAGDRRD